MDNKLEQIQAQLSMLESLLLGNKKTLTIEEACTYTGYTIGYMYKLTSTGQIPHYKRGKKVFFDMDELDTWMKKYKVEDVQETARRMASKT